MIKLKQILLEGGAKAGKLETASISVEAAHEYAKKEFEKYNTNLDEELPDFDKNFKLAQALIKSGHTKRKDMPVIETQDIKDLQARLANGYIDITEPHSKKVSKTNPFPEGLSGADAKQWLKNGLQKYDKAKSDKDDIVSVKRKSVPVNKLKPIQQQVYFDKSIDLMAKFGVSESSKFMKTQTFVISKDNYIIDGHHRFQSMMIVNPSGKANVISIDLPLSKLLPMTIAYGDAIGNKRNA